MQTMKCSGGCGRDCALVPPGLDTEDDGLEGYIAREMPEPSSIKCSECYERDEKQEIVAGGGLEFTPRSSGFNAPLFIIKPDGTIERCEGFTTTDEASLKFWEAIAAGYPVWKQKALEGGIMQITKYIKAFISGMMGEPAVGFDSILASFLSPPNIKWLSLQEMEHIQPKRKYKKRKK